MNKELKIILGIAVVILAGGVFLFLKGNPQPQEAGKPADGQSLVREDSHGTGGGIKSKVVLVEFGDFQCPACGAVHPLLKQVVDTYKDNSNFSFVFRQFPLTSIHKNAFKAAEVSEAAGAQGKFWEMHDLLYEKQSEWSESPDAMVFFTKYATDLGLDASKLQNEVNNGVYKAIVQAGMDDGNTLQVPGTPTFFLNGTKLSGITSLDDIKSKIDAELAK